MSSRKRQYGIEGHIQPSMHITWGIYCRIPDSGDTWAKEVLGTYVNAEIAREALRMLLIGRGIDIDAAGSRAAYIMQEAQKKVDTRLIEMSLHTRRNGHHALTTKGSG